MADPTVSRLGAGRWKNRVEDLSRFGGEPAFSEARYVGTPNIGHVDHFLRRMETILSSRRLTNNGPFVQEFEDRIAEMTGVRHCIAVTNATAGLDLAIRAAGMSGEVLVPSFTFVAAAHTLRLQGIRPVFCEIEPATHRLDLFDLESKITSRTTGILAVHLWGRPEAVEQLTAIAERRSLKLIFDAAHALGCSYRGRMIGGFGCSEVFSFHGTKFINSFEGGAVTTNDDNLAERVRLMRNFGFADYDEVVMAGLNAKMTEAAAAMGLTSLESKAEFIQVNRARYERYRNQLANVPGLSICAYDENERNNYQYVVIEIDEQKLGITRDLLKDILWAENVHARRYFYPGCHRMEPYRSDPRNAGVRLDATDAVAARVLTLPTGTAMTEEDVVAVCQTIKLVAAQAAAIVRLEAHATARY